ncbi:DUF2127 domain-containing protein [Lysinimonas soli]|uniref:DUF2127 domain-containing protein n=1 Tax=Lysinimonas soli TaxID=1074233 RepID=A0ABW0NP82_9MICO
MTEAKPPTHTALDRVFRVSLALKGADGILELIGGVLLLLVSPRQLNDLVRVLTQHELSEDPHDLIATTLVHAVSGLSTSASLFGAIYLLLHGLVKVVLVIAVLLDRLWAYLWIMAFLAIFIVYQCYQLVVGFGWGLALLTAFDVFVVWLTWREYRIHRDRRRQTTAAASP